MVQLTAYLALRNEIKLIRHGHYAPRGITEIDGARLEKIINEIDELHSDSEGGVYRTRNAVAFSIGPERSRNPKRSAQLFEGIHGIIKRYDIDAGIYANLGGAFGEIRQKPKKDTAKAIKHAEELMNEIFYRDPAIHILWQDARHNPKKALEATLGHYRRDLQSEVW